MVLDFFIDIALVLETTNELNIRLEQWREALIDDDMRISQENFKYLRCNFDKNVNERNNKGENPYLGSDFTHEKV